MIRAKIEAFRISLQEQRFYDAHEVLEELWFPRRFEASNEVKILKGFINAAVSFELHKRGRSTQSNKVWLNYLKYRQLLYKLNTTSLNIYYQLSRDIEQLHRDKAFIIRVKQAIISRPK